MGESQKHFDKNSHAITVYKLLSTYCNERILIANPGQEVVMRIEQIILEMLDQSQKKDGKYKQVENFKTLHALVYTLSAIAFFCDPVTDSYIRS